MSNSELHLEIIHQMMTGFSSDSTLNTAIKKGLSYLCTTLRAEAASFFILNEETQNLECHACLGPVDITGIIISKDQGIIGKTVTNNQLHHILDCKENSSFLNDIDRYTGFTTKSIICAPLFCNNQMLGAIELLNRQGEGENEQFSYEDAQSVHLLAKAAALALLNLRLTTSMLETEQLKRNLHMAARVQENLFPQQHNPYAYGNNIPKAGISGDLFDYIQHSNLVYFCIADVSGKGIDAALIMTKTHSLFRNLTRQSFSIEHIIQQINYELYETSINGMFVTALIGYYDIDTQNITICNAGHEAGLILRNNGFVEYIRPSIHPLGITIFEQGDITCQNINISDARFFGYSDGLTQVYPQERIADDLYKKNNDNLKTQISSIMTQVEQNSTQIQDDLTILGIGQ